MGAISAIGRLMRHGNSVAAAARTSGKSAEFLLGSLGLAGIVAAPAVGGAAIGGFLVVGIGCSLYERFISGPKRDARENETAEFVKATKDRLVRAIANEADVATQRSLIAQVLNERAEALNSKLEELDAQHPLRAMADIDNALRDGDDQKLEEVLCVHDSFEAAIARYIEKEFDVLHVALGMMTEELIAVRGQLATCDQRLSRVEQNLEVIAQGGSIHIDLRLPLEVFDPSNPPSNPFVYSLQRVPLYGREQELERLLAFLRHSNVGAPQWWLWYGSAGTGKTRLAHRLCLEARSMGWNAGFVPRDTSFQNWSRLALTCNTLIVVDYVAERASGVARAIASLRDVHSKSPYKLRFILLERSDSGPWRDEFDRCGGSQDLATGLQNSRFSAPSRLAELSDVDLERIIRFVLLERGKSHSTSESLKVLNRVDPERRALFAAMVADAICDLGLDIVGKWNVGDLLRNMLQMELERWASRDERGREPMDAAHVNALFLATLIDGLAPDASSESIDEAAREGIVPGIKGRIERVPRHWSRMARYARGSHSTGDTLPRIQPDILGECFVLSRLLGTLRIGDESPERARTSSEGLLALAWKINSLATAYFSSLVVRDFRNDSIRTPIMDARPATQVQRMMWAQLVVSLTAFSDFRNPSEIERVTSCIDDLRRLRVAHDESTLREALAMALYNAHFETGRTGELAQKLLEELRTLADRHDEPALREQLAKALYNAHFETDGTGELAQKLLNDLRSLADRHDEPALRKQLAKALYNAHFETDRTGELAQKLLEVLRDLANRHKEPALRELLAKALYNAHVKTDRTGELAQKLLEELRKLAHSHDEPTLRELLAEALFNAHVETDGNGELAQKLLNDLRSLADRHDEPALRKQLAKALYNAHFETDRTGELAQKLLEELRDLANRHKEPALRELLAKALYNAHFKTDGTGELAQKLLNDLRSLADRHDEPALRKQLAKALYNAHLAIVRTGQSAESLLDELRTLAHSHDEPILKEILAAALYNRPGTQTE